MNNKHNDALLALRKIADYDPVGGDEYLTALALVQKWARESLAEHPAGAVGELPPLPTMKHGLPYSSLDYYSGAQMRDYGRMCMAIAAPPDASVDVLQEILALLNNVTAAQDSEADYLGQAENMLRRMIDSADGAKCAAAGGSAKCQARDGGALCQWCGGDVLDTPRAEQESE